MLPWLADHPGTTVDEVSTRFGVDPAQLVRDLELLGLCGLPPYTPDRLIEVWIEGDEIMVELPDAYERLPIMSTAEVLAVLAAGQTLLGVRGDDPTLESALVKLAAATGVRNGPDIALDTPDHLDTVRAAAVDGACLEIEYFSYGRDELTTRVIEPHAVHFEEGHWRAQAFCRLAQEPRTFRVDRIRSAHPTGDTFIPATIEPGIDTETYAPRADDVRVTIRLPESGRWVIETFPVEDVNDHGDVVDVTMAISEAPWLERLLLTLGPDAVVVTPPEWRGLAAVAARRVLDRYR